jgi:hypothetical protein
MSKIPAGALAWARSSDTGISSLTLFEALSGQEVFGLTSRDIPYDAADFGRCYRLLAAAGPAWAKRLRVVADRHPKWGPLVARWADLTSLYKCQDWQGVYNLIREVRPACMKADGWIRTGPGSWERERAPP